MPKTYNCPECSEAMEAKYQDQNSKTIWYCKKCDAFFGIEIPFRYTIKNTGPTKEDIVGVNSSAELGEI